MIRAVTCHPGGPSSIPCPAKLFFQKNWQRFWNPFANYVICANFWAGKNWIWKAGPTCANQCETKNFQLCEKQPFFMWLLWLFSGKSQENSSITFLIVLKIMEQLVRIAGLWVSKLEILSYLLKFVSNNLELTSNFIIILGIKQYSLRNFSLFKIIASINIFWESQTKWCWTPCMMESICKVILGI